QPEDGIRHFHVTRVQTCALPIFDICPVGALTSIDWRFRARIWEMSSSPSITVTNAKGSNCEYWVRDNLVLRITPRQNLLVNDYWLPDEDRLVYPMFNENRPRSEEHTSELQSRENLVCRL